ncbi:MAG TPA: hypothetical protein VFR50_07725, partial [Casimicrobiaceae bacterium]|nr:hypothetical protein [Casimicrobiaceae bacterium]
RPRQRRRQRANRGHGWNRRAKIGDGTGAHKQASASRLREMNPPSDIAGSVLAPSWRGRDGDTRSTTMAETTAKLESGKSRLQDVGDRAQDYVDRASAAASSGMDRLTETARKGVDTAAESARAGLDWASEQASALRDRNTAIMNALTDSVTARPLVAIGVAAAIGYLLGRIMSNSD